MSDLFLKIKKLFKGMFEKKVTWFLLLTGATILSSGYTQNWWKGIAVSFINEVFNTHIKYEKEEMNYPYLIISTIIGIGLISLALWFYFKTKEKEKKETMLRIQHSSIESVDYSKSDTDLSEYKIEEFPISQMEELEVLDKASLKHALREQEKVVKKILQRIEGRSDIELSYWGLAHIPLLLLLGYQISDKSNSSFYEWNQNKLKWEKLKEKRVRFPELKLSVDDAKQMVEETTEVVVKIGITYPILDTDLDGLGLDSLNSYYLHLDPPHRNAIISIEQISQYKVQFRQLLDDTNQRFPKLKRIHLFYSGQPSLAYRLGSSITSRMDKEIIVYNYLGQSYPKYNWAINLKKVNKPIDITILEDK